MRELLVAQFRLSAEARAVERAIENGGQHDALRRLLEVEPLLGRRPEFRYLRYLFDLTFHIRAAGALLPELVNLVAEHPELSEATALLAEVYERSGDPQRAEFFARIALGSESESARARAACVIDRGAQPAPVSDGPRDNTRIHVDPDPRDDDRLEVRRSQRVRASPPPVDVNAPVEAWFDYAKQQLLQRRTPTYGVRSLRSVSDKLLDCALELAIKPSEFSDSSLPLTRAALERIDHTVVELRKAHAPGTPLHADVARVHAVAGFLLAVVLHELEGTAMESRPTMAAARSSCPRVRACARCWWPPPFSTAPDQGSLPPTTAWRPRSSLPFRPSIRRSPLHRGSASRHRRQALPRRIGSRRWRPATTWAIPPPLRRAGACRRQAKGRFLHRRAGPPRHRFDRPHKGAP